MKDLSTKRHYTTFLRSLESGIMYGKWYNIKIKAMGKIKRLKRKKFSSPAKRKALLLLQAGVALGLTHSPKTHFFIFRELKREWEKINRQYLYRIIREFKYERLVDWKEQDDGSIKVVLTEKGEEWALQFNFEEMKIKEPASWDGKWRVVLYDIPEKRKKAREALRKKIKELGFYEMQKSVFVFPYHCRDEIDFVIEFFEVRNFVHYGEMMNLSNEARLKMHFNLS